MLVQNGENQQSQWIPDQKDNVISWLQGEFAAANAIIDALCQHLRTVGEPSEYNLVLTSIQQRRYNWTPVLYRQQYVSIAEVMCALQQVAGRRQQRDIDYFSTAKINYGFNEKDNESSWTEIHGRANHRSVSEGSINHPIESVKKSGLQIPLSQKGSKGGWNSSGRSYDDKRELVGTTSALHPVEGDTNLTASGTSEYVKNDSSLLSSALSGELKEGDGSNWVSEEYSGSGNTRPNGTEEHGESNLSDSQQNDASQKGRRSKEEAESNPIRQKGLDGASIAHHSEVQGDNIQEVPAEAVKNSMATEASGQGRHCMHENGRKSDPELTEFELLLKNKTFSREEFNHLAELLQSRIVESSSGLKDYVEQMKGELHSGVEPINVANANALKWCDEREKERHEKENVVWDNSLLRNTASLAMPPSNIGAPTFIDIHGSSPSPVQTHNQSLSEGVSAADQSYTSTGKAPLFSSVAMPAEVPLSSGIGDATLQSSDSVFVREDANSAVLDIRDSAPQKSKGFRMSALEILQESDEEDRGDKKSPVSVHGETGKFTSIQPNGSDGDVNSLKIDKPIQTLLGDKASAGTELSTRTVFSATQSTFAPTSGTLEFSGGGFCFRAGCEKSGTSGTLEFSGGGFCFRAGAQKCAPKFLKDKGGKSRRKWVRIFAWTDLVLVDICHHPCFKFSSHELALGMKSGILWRALYTLLEGTTVISLIWSSSSYLDYWFLNVKVAF